MKKTSQYAKLAVTYSFLLILILGTAVTNVSGAGTADAFSLEPSTATIESVGQNVTINVTITNITDCAGFNFWIFYDSTVLNFTSSTFDTDNANPLSPTQIVPNASDRVDTDSSTDGNVRLAVVWKFPGPVGYNGSGLAAQLTFTGLKIGNSTLIINQDWTYASDSEAGKITFNTFDDSFISVVPEFTAAFILSLFFTATLAAAFLAKKAWSRERRN